MHDPQSLTRFRSDRGPSVDLDRKDADTPEAALPSTRIPASRRATFRSAWSAVDAASGPAAAWT
jgi:hypothetical protein